jgi:hypothetical protein
MAQLKQSGKHSLCATKRESIQKEDVTNLCANWRRDYEQHIRASQNEWLLEDMSWHCDELNKILYAQWKAGLICKKAYQDCMAIAWEQWAGLAQDCIDAEEECN